MLNAKESPAEPSVSVIIEDIEKRIEDAYVAQKSDVEQGLLEKINKEKEEAQKKIEVARNEFEKVRGALQDHRQAIAELESAHTALRSQIMEHFERAKDNQKLIEKAAILSVDELQKIDDLNRQLGEVHQRASEQTMSLRKLLKEQAGMVPELPSFDGLPGLNVDWSQELHKMKKIQELLASSNGSEIHDAAPDQPAEAASAPEPARIQEPAAEPQPEPQPELQPEQEPAKADEPASAAPAAADTATPAAEAAQDAGEFPESDPGWDEIPTPPAPDTLPEEPSASPSDPRGAWLDDGHEEERIEDVVPDQARSTQSLSKVLAEYLKTESINNGVDLAFFELGPTTLLDGDSFVAAIGTVLATARDLHDQLTRTESVKELFLLKQEILNQQEVLRKLYFRVVRFCDKESGVLPAFLEDIINVQSLKDSLERLTMANWSDPSDFAPFVREIEALKSAFEAKTDPPGDYIQSVLEQVGMN